MKKGDVTTDNEEIQRIIIDYYEVTICQENGHLGRNRQILRK